MTSTACQSTHTWFRRSASRSAPHSGYGPLPSLLELQMEVAVGTQVGGAAAGTSPGSKAARRGEPIVPNGLCKRARKLHHAAFGAYILGVRPDYVIEEVRRSSSTSSTEPIVLSRRLRSAAVSKGGQLIHWPRDRRLRPRSGWLEGRYEMFRKAG